MAKKYVILTKSGSLYQIAKGFGGALKILFKGNWLKIGNIQKIEDAIGDKITFISGKNFGSTSTVKKFIEIQ